ncbi:hypothetical protein E2C01_089545 [Portunus trituberculatus]|uniref:Uncharacterized protein n=1 Tax=Portunus trituberculatus TaxID=210409 RepID=A0A5B7JMN9_PORTR|nr:hypothetical protein [Portunus trituberculatus]
MEARTVTTYGAGLAVVVVVYYLVTSGKREDRGSLSSLPQACTPSSVITLPRSVAGRATTHLKVRSVSLV